MRSFAEHFRVEILNINSHFIRFGESDNKIIFLHGWGGDTNSFFELAEKLRKSRKDLELILLDLPGFGKTENPEIKGWNTIDYAHWLNKILEQVIFKQTDFVKNKQKISKNIHFYGHSFGCRVLVRFLTQIEPNWMGKIILTGAAGLKFSRSFRERSGLIASKLLKPAKYFIPTKIRKKVVAKIFGAHDWQNVNKAMKKTLEKTLVEPDFREDLKKIKQETLLIWGKNDTYTPLLAGKIYHQNIKNSKLKILENGRHGIGRTHPQEIANFLDDFIEHKASKML